ncbi:MAG: DUF547 domain-containing protein [candidate division Zixibacteria bacterium]|nr:DUF547 domain-containing protein [candidate division Zixibacteria bacterium]
MRRFQVILIIAFIALFSPCINAGEFSHAHYDSLLKEYVSNGRVDYSGIKENPRLLNIYLDKLKHVNKHEFVNWEENERLAFWINAYNAITIFGVIENYPIGYGSLVSRLRFPKSSIRQISDFWKKSWSEVMGEDISLDKIEHEIIRKRFYKPEIHFALVCASIGCPPLQSYAFNPDSLDYQLKIATRQFINEKGGVRINREVNTVELSEIFKWYADDFKTDANPPQLSDYKDKERWLLYYIINYADENLSSYIINNKPKIKYYDYDWTLNDQEE